MGDFSLQQLEKELATLLILNVSSSPFQRAGVQAVI